MTRARDAAIGYARRGWLVIPIEPRGKRPALGKGMNHASRDVDVVDTWWLFEPKAGVGLVCSEASGLLVIDVDPRSGGVDSMRRLVERVGPLWKTTLTAETGGGGHHLVYQHPGGRLRNGAHVLGRGVDVKALGYIVAAPSIHPSGNAYRWLPGPSEPQPIPGRLLELLRPPVPEERPRSDTPVRLSGSATPYGAVALRGLVAEVAAATEGSRNETLNRCAFRGYRLAAGGELPLGDVSEALEAAASWAGLDETEIAATLASARRQALRQPAAAPSRTVA